MSTLFTNFLWGLTGELQSMRVADGRVLERAPELPAEGSTKVDLDGKFLLPALTDCHAHILNTGLDLAKLHLGAAESREAVLQQVADRNKVDSSEWLLAVHYDQNKWGGTHLTRHDLDAISSIRPILLRHVNGHASVANSAALQAANVTPQEKDPTDGSYGRDADGSVNGVLFEGAHERVSRAIPRPTLDQCVEAICAAGRSMAAFGIASATDMQTNATEIPAYLEAARRGCPVQLNLYVVWKDAFGPKADLDGLEPLRGHGPVRVAGVKLFADGAIGSATAAIYGSYASAPSAGSRTSGQLMYSPDRLRERVRVATEAGYSVATHAIGDYALDVVLDAYEASGAPSRHRIEHAMLASDAQLTRIRDLGISVAMQPEFLVRFGHAYRAQLGPDRAFTLKRFRSFLSAGIPLAFSSDRPICAGNPWIGVDCASARPPAFDPSENLTRAEAIQRYLNPARLIGGEACSGTLEAGDQLKAITMATDPLRPGQPEKLAFLQEF